MSIKIASMNFGDCDTILHNTPNGMKNIAEILGPNGEVYWSAIKELTGIPPLSIRSNGTMLLNYLISGNMSQTGTPTPDNPVDANGVGVMTGNLFDMSTAEDTAYYIDFRGSLLIGSNGDRFIAQKVKVTPLTEYTFSWGDTILGTENNSPHIRVVEYANTEFLGRTLCKCIDYANKIFTIITRQNTNVLDIRYDSGTSLRKQTITNLMINEGSTVLSYEPYGYKIPISSGDVTTNIYLGSTQTVRQIKKVVLTGNESGWVMSGTGLFYNLTLPDNPKEMSTVVSTHFIATTNPSSVEIGCIRFAGTAQSPTQPLIFNYDNGAIRLTAFKQWLADQYAAGTPVTIWYALATPETGIVNEPLMKIGDYADTVSMEQAGVSIPTLNGQTVVDVETTLKPSQMYIKYK